MSPNAEGMCNITLEGDCECKLLLLASVRMTIRYLRSWLPLIKTIYAFSEMTLTINSVNVLMHICV